VSARLRAQISGAVRKPAVVALTALAILFSVHAVQVQHGTTDTLGLLHGVAVIDKCLHAHEWSCGTAGFGSVGPSAILQYLPGVAFKRAGATFVGAARDLSLLNSVALLGLLVMLWRTGRRVGDVRLAALLALLAVSGPLFWYATAGFGEGLGAFFVTAFACALVTRSGGVVLGLSLFGAAISKEPALPFLLGLAFVVLRQADPVSGVRIRRGQIAGLALGGGAALATNIAFNAFRSSEGGAAGAAPLAHSLTHISVPPPTVAQKAEAVVSLIAAPNVGLIWFWPVALGCIALGLLATWRASPSFRAFLGSPAVGGLFVFGLFVAGVASFNSPYGFIGWGPRYLVPWTPAFALIVLYRDWPVARATLDALARRAALAVPVAVIVLALALSQLAAFLNPNRVYDHFNAGGSCPTRLLDIQEWAQTFGDVDSYYDCTRYLAWTKGPLLVDVDGEFGKASSSVYLLVYSLAVVTLMGVAAGRLPASLARDPQSAAAAS
jgi:hypothetical protein